MNKFFVIFLSMTMCMSSKHIFCALRESIADGVPFETEELGDHDTLGARQVPQTYEPAATTTTTTTTTTASMQGATEKNMDGQNNDQFCSPVVSAANALLKAKSFCVNDLDQLPPEIVASIINNMSQKLARVRFMVEEGECVRALLYGSPGTGKTTFVQSIAQHLHMPLHYVLVSNLINEYQGSGEANIERVLSPLIADRKTQRIILLDELDEVRGYGDKSASVMKALCSQISRSNDRHVYIGTTNHIDKIFPELLDRFDFKIKVSEPSFEYRKAILKSLLGNLGKNCSCPACLRDDAFMNHFAKKTGDLSIRKLKAIVSNAKALAFVRSSRFAKEGKRPAAMLEENDLWESLHEVQEELAVTEESRLYKVGLAVERAWPMINTAIGTAQFCYSEYRQCKQFEESQQLQRQQMVFSAVSHCATMIQTQENFNRSHHLAIMQFKAAQDAAKTASDAALNQSEKQASAQTDVSKCAVITGGMLSGASLGARGGGSGIVGGAVLGGLITGLPVFKDEIWVGTKKAAGWLSNNCSIQ